MRAIGGYFKLDLPDGGHEYHQGAIKLNTGRNALEYVLRANNYEKIFLPLYTCHVMLQPIERLGIPYELYHINESLEPEFDFGRLNKGDVFLYNNYFGIKGSFLPKLKDKAPNLIVDNVQAFFDLPLTGVPTFYSARKFFGVPDGAYLYSEKGLNGALEQDISHSRFAHLLIRLEEGPEKGYATFVENDKQLDHQPVKRMSRLTELLLREIDYQQHATERVRNFNYFHDLLGSKNELKISLADEHHVPMAYPFLGGDDSLHARLVESRIYVPRYWPRLLSDFSQTTLENKLVTQLIPLPIDKSIDLDDIMYMVNKIKG